MIEEFRRIGRLLFEEGLAGGGAGSVSVRSQEGITITRRGADLADLREGDLVSLGMEKSEKDNEAAVEIAAHRAIYKASSQAQAVIQCFPPSAIALSIVDEKLMPQDAQGRALLKTVAVVKTREAVASEDTLKVFPTIFAGSYNTALIRSYCAFAAGTDLAEAYRRCSAVERSARIIIDLRSIAPPPQPHRPKPQSQMRHGAIPPGIGVMDRSRYQKR